MRSGPASASDLAGNSRRFADETSICCAAGLGEDPFAKPGCLVSPQVGAQALQLLRDLIVLCSPECLSRNPIQTYRRMATSEDAAYCPFAFGYSNYSRAGYLPASLRFGDLVTLYGRSLRSTLGGAGLAISARCRNLPWALQFLEYTASGSCQQNALLCIGRSTRAPDGVARFEDQRGLPGFLHPDVTGSGSRVPEAQAQRISSFPARRRAGHPSVSARGRRCEECLRRTGKPCSVCYMIDH